LQIVFLTAFSDPIRVLLKLRELSFGSMARRLENARLLDRFESLSDRELGCQPL
jgi:hypothetical protein